MFDLFVYIRNVENLVHCNDPVVTGIILADRYFSSSNAGLENEEIRKAVEMIHGLGKKALLKVDRLYSQKELDLVRQYLLFLADCKVDGIIYTDLGINMMMEELNIGYKGIYAPETLLTDYYDINTLKNDGVDGCVISKDIPLKDVYEIINEVPDYCYLRIHGPILIAYSRRKYITSYLEKSGDYSEDYWLVEESRDNRLPLIEKENGSWLYDATLQSFNEIKKLNDTALKGALIDNVYLSDEYTLKTLKLYEGVLNGSITAEEAINELKEFDETVRYADINELKETWLDKEKA
ncbi:MAG: U32 family peptidase [Erysipelotrichaceae bacterium]|nr:U32 family peptidase [Erysipelotrichaceae bacterium]